MIHFCKIVNHMALPATEPASINITLQARRLTDSLCCRTNKKTGDQISEVHPHSQTTYRHHPRYHRPPAIEHLFARAPATATDHRSACQIMPAHDGTQYQSQYVQSRQNQAPPGPASFKTVIVLKLRFPFDLLSIRSFNWCCKSF